MSETSSVYIGSPSRNSIDAEVYFYELRDNEVAELLTEYEETNDEELLVAAKWEAAEKGDILGPEKGYGWGYRGAGPENLVEDIVAREKKMNEEWFREMIVETPETDENWILWPNMHRDEQGPVYRFNCGIEYADEE